MTEEYIVALLDRWQERLNMEHWRIAVVVKPDVSVGGRLAFMRMCRSEYFDRGTLEVAACVLDPSQLPDSIERDLVRTGSVTHEEYVEETIVHELLHLQFRDMVEAADLVTNNLAPQVVGVWDAAWRRAEEATVERMAIALMGNWGSK